MEWDDGSIDPYHILDGPGVYWLDYLDQGCLFRDSMQVVAGYCEDCRVYVPNIFSPNGDGHNDVLAIQTNCTLSTFSWQIWDRWGTLVFSTRDPSASWDGRVGQSMAPVGVYVFRMNGLTPDGGVRDQGTITLIR
ncbi:MAG TPA: gliding motility-associated C-terminal domain-containing protein [Saprospiraceae bacterium]|nr:gliding motility-associated C-terminal domain-containing protein [Saprospiraceae bacterium]